MEPPNLMKLTQMNMESYVLFDVSYEVDKSVSYLLLLCETEAAKAIR